MSNDKLAATFHGADEALAENVPFAIFDALRLERDALQDALIRVLDALPPCSQCGQPFRARACGPTHAVVAADPASHRMFGEGDTLDDLFPGLGGMGDALDRRPLELTEEAS